MQGEGIREMRVTFVAPRSGAAMTGAVLLALGGATPALALVCGDPPPKAVVEVEVSEPEVEFDHRRSKAELTKLASEEYGYGHGVGATVLGLTTGRIWAQLSVQTYVKQRSDGVYCSWPAKVVAAVTFDGPLVVRVAREYPKGTCQHRAVLLHEMKHVEIHKTALRDYEKRLRRALERAIDKGRFPLTDRKRDTVDAEMGDVLQPAFKRAIAEAESERDRRNAQIDSQEGYRRTRDLCDSW